MLLSLTLLLIDYTYLYINSSFLGSKFYNYFKNYDHDKYKFSSDSFFIILILKFNMNKNKYF